VIRVEFSPSFSPMFIPRSGLSLSIGLDFILPIKLQVLLFETIDPASLIQVLSLLFVAIACEFKELHLTAKSSQKLNV
jgi:hypothetical protein